MKATRSAAKHGGVLKLIAAMIAGLGVWVLAGCQERLTLAEAQARCTQQAGFLVIIHTQKINKAGVVGPEIDSPGDCVSPGKFDVPPPATGKVPAGAN